MNDNKPHFFSAEERFGRGYDLDKALTALKEPSEPCHECGYVTCDCPCAFCEHEACDCLNVATVTTLLTQDPTVTAIQGIVADMRADVNEAGEFYEILAPFIGSYIMKLELLASQIRENKNGV